MANILRVPTTAAVASSLIRSTTKNTGLLISTNAPPTKMNLPNPNQQQQIRTMVQRASKKKGFNKGVRVILTTDVTDNGGMYTHEVHKVKPGFARNYLIPERKALYATPENFERLGLKDPDVETMEERRIREEREAKEAQDAEGSEELKAADFLAYYLRNKVLKIKRNVDPSTNAVYPGLVNHHNIRQKLSKQLKIDLDDHELVHINSTPVIHAELTEKDVDKIMSNLGKSVDNGEECGVKLKALGEFVARITLAGNYAVPLKFVVVKR